jgi:hypothetical protein
MVFARRNRRKERGEKIDKHVEPKFEADWYDNPDSATVYGHFYCPEGYKFEPAVPFYTAGFSGTFGKNEVRTVLEHRICEPTGSSDYPAPSGYREAVRASVHPAPGSQTPPRGFDEVGA